MIIFSTITNTSSQGTSPSDLMTQLTQLTKQYFHKVLGLHTSRTQRTYHGSTHPMSYSHNLTHSRPCDTARDFKPDYVVPHENHQVLSTELTTQNQLRL